MTRTLIRFGINGLIELMHSHDKIAIYTDGSFKQGRGSWAYIFVKNEIVIHEASGRAKKTSSHRMEFQAAIEALQNLPLQSVATLYSDSKVLIQTLNLWIPQWQENQWRKKRDLPIPNLDLVKVLYELNLRHLIEWRWIKAHSGIKHNERCDELCLLARTIV